MSASLHFLGSLMTEWRNPVLFIFIVSVSGREQMLTKCGRKEGRQGDRKGGRKGGREGNISSTSSVRKNSSPSNHSKYICVKSDSKCSFHSTNILWICLMWCAMLNENWDLVPALKKLIIQWGKGKNNYLILPLFVLFLLIPHNFLISSFKKTYSFFFLTWISINRD